MSIEDYTFEVIRRLTFLCTPAGEFLNIDLKENRQLISKIEFFSELSSNQELFTELAKQGNILINRFREQHIHLFDNVFSYTTSDLRLKLMETEEKQYDYTYSGFVKSGKIYKVNSSMRKKWFNIYEKEINRYDEIFKRFIDSKASKNVSKLTLTKIPNFAITKEQVAKLFYLNINEGNNKNESLFNTHHSNDAAVLYEIMKKPHTIIEMEPKPKFVFNCENRYAIFVFKWLELKKFTTQSASYIDKTKIFYPKSEKMVLTLRRIGSDWDALQKKCPNLKEILSELITKSSHIDVLDESAGPSDIIKYLHYNLSKIFLQPKN